MWHSLLNPVYLLELFGYAGLGVVVFAETGLLVGVFLPGDTLLIAAGIFASRGHLNITLAITIIVVAAIVGDTVGYFFGNKVGPRLFKREDARFFSRENVQEGHAFFEKYGPQSVILARFIPGVRTCVPVVAGVTKMSYRKFAAYNVMGGLFWGVVVTMLGYTLGRIVPHIDSYILPVVIIVSIASFVPAIMHFKNRRAVKEGLR